MKIREVQYDFLINLPIRFKYLFHFEILGWMLNGLHLGSAMHVYNLRNTVWCNQMGTVGKLTLFERLKLLNWWSHLSPVNFYSSVFASSKSYFLLKTCQNMFFISCRLMKNFRFRIVPIWLLHTVEKKEEEKKIIIFSSYLDQYERKKRKA